MDVYEGGCLCGAVRFRARAPATKACFCHCRSCRRASGAPVVAWATFAAAGVRITRGTLREHRSSEKVTRGFCGACGTGITYVHDATPDEIDLALATLDDPSAIPPESHIWVSHRLQWMTPGDGLPQYAEWRTG